MRKRVVSLAPSRNGYNSFARWRRTRRRASTDARDSRNTSRAVFARYLSPSVRRTRAPALGSASVARTSRPSGRHISRPSGRPPPRRCTRSVAPRRLATMGSSSGMNDTSGGARNATARGSGSGDAKPSSRGGSDRSAPRGVANRAAQLRVAEKKRQAEAGYLGRERPIAADLPPYWSTSKHGMPFTATANPRASASATTKPRSSTEPRRAPVVAAATKPRGVRASLRALDAPMTPRERLRAVMSLPPNEQILALVSGLDRDPEAPPWTGRRPRPMAPRPRTHAPRRRRARGSHATLPRRDCRARERAFDVPRVERARFSHPRVHARG